MNTSFKVGIFVLFTAFIAGYLIITFESKNWTGDTKEYFLYFDDISGLSKGADVSVKGLKAGKVKDIYYDDGKIKVVVAIKKDIPIHQNAKAYIKTMGLMGDKYVYIDPGSPENPVIPEKGKIKNTLTLASAEDTFNDISLAAKKFEKLMDNLNEAVGNGRLVKLIDNINSLAVETRQVVAENRENLRKSIENIEKITAQLKETIPPLVKKIEKIANNLEQITGDNKEDIRQIIVSLKNLAKTLEKKVPKTVDNINVASKKAKEILSDNQQDIRKAVKYIRSSAKKLDTILAKINKGKGTLGKLVNENSLYDTVNEGIKDFSKPFKVINESKLYVSLFGEQHTGNKDRKAGAFIALMPKDDRYIYASLLSNSNGNISEVEEINTNGTISTRTKRDLNILVDIQYARQVWKTRYGNLWVRAGLKESSAGAGIDWWFSENTRLNLDLYKFNRKYAWNEPNSPELDLGIFYKLKKSPLFFRFGGSDLLVSEYKGIYFGVGLMFTDDYLKYMLGLSNAMR